MSFIFNKAASVLGAVILLATACTISVSAQSSTRAHAAVNTLLVQPDTIRETSDAPAAKKPATADGTDSATGPAAASEATTRSEVAAPVAAPAGTVVAGGTANESREATAATRSPQAADDDKWHFQVTPYGWMVSLHGNAGVGNRTTQLDESFSDVWHVLDFVIMGTFEARKGKFISLTDVEYVAISDDKATPGPFFSDVTAKFKEFIFDTEGGYRVFENSAKGQSIDVLGGIRVWHVNTELNFGAGILPAATVDGSRTWVDGVAGLRGKAALSEKVFVTGKFDLGGGGSNFTWQVFGALGYNIKPNIALIGGYRVLDVNYNKNNFLFDVNERGPIVGLGFRF